jgi:hypothetical protein
MPRIIPFVLLVAAACEPIHGNTYQLRYQVTPRNMLLGAIDAARELHYNIVAVESPDIFHNMFLAFADKDDPHNPTALLVTLSYVDDACPPSGCTDIPGTKVAVTPMAFRNGKAIPDANVPARTKAHAEELMYAIYGHNLENRRPML